MKSLLRCAAVLSAALSIALVGCTSAPKAAGPGTGTGASFKGPIGVQLYSLRGQFTRNVPETFKLVESFGIQEVELAGTYNLPNAAFLELLKAHGLKAISAHFAFDRFKNDPEGVAREAKELGLKYVGVAWIPHQGKFDGKAAREAAAVFNKAGEILAKDGIKCFYHCHGYEFERDSAGLGTTAMDILIRETKPEWMTFQMDILWVFFPGEDPAQWLERYPGRWELMHMKDLKLGVKTGIHTGGTDPNNDVALGTGQMDWPRILKAAQKSGVKHYFIEDESASSATQIPQTLKFLEQVKF